MPYGVGLDTGSDTNPASDRRVNETCAAGKLIPEPAKEVDQG